jgi:hypothetical protein
MTYAIRAWRDSNGGYGIAIGHVEPVGYDNHVVEVTLEDAEIDGFLAACAAARQRARDAAGPLLEKMPGPYDKWDLPTDLPSPQPGGSTADRVRSGQ